MSSILKSEVQKANQELGALGLVKMTFGNLSARKGNYVFIKPSGVAYNVLKAEDIVVTDLQGKVIQGTMKPSTDLPSHLELYRNFPEIRSVVHTHSEYATIFAQARTPLICLGTTHADYFQGSIPVTRDLTPREIQENYELNTGKVIAELFNEKAINCLMVPACLVASHGPFVWGQSIDNAVENAFVLEEIARMNYRTLTLNHQTPAINPDLLNKHFQRKHGKNAYYGQ